MDKALEYAVRVHGQPVSHIQDDIRNVMAMDYQWDLLVMHFTSIWNVCATVVCVG